MQPSFKTVHSPSSVEQEQMKLSFRILLHLISNNFFCPSCLWPSCPSISQSVHVQYVQRVVIQNNRTPEPSVDYDRYYIMMSRCFDIPIWQCCEQKCNSVFVLCVGWVSSSSSSSSLSSIVLSSRPSSAAAVADSTQATSAVTSTAPTFWHGIISGVWRRLS